MEPNDTNPAPAWRQGRGGGTPHLDDEEHVLRRVGDGEDGGARQGGDGGRLDVGTQHGLGLLRVQVEEEVLWDLPESWATQEKHERDGDWWISTPIGSFI